MDNRRRRNSFPFHEDDLSADPAHPQSASGFIAEILDGVVFTPPGSEITPRPPPDNRSRSSLTTFRNPSPTPPAVRNTPEDKSKIKLPVPAEAVDTDKQILFQQELSATIKKRSQNLDSGNSGGGIRPQSPLPPLPILPAVVEEINALENPLYQSLAECISGSESIQLPDKQIIPESTLDSTYSNIGEVDSHYQTVVSGTPVSSGSFYHIIDQPQIG